MPQVTQAERGGGAIREQPQFWLMTMCEPLTGIHHQAREEEAFQGLQVEGQTLSKEGAHYPSAEEQP